MQWTARGPDSPRQLLCTSPRDNARLVPGRLLNANKINCVRPDAFQDLQNLSLLSLYDNKIQSLAKGTFTSLRAIQTL
ncbi:hypothetical protein GH733_001038 [Mirounga leonina]|nr:hypothetical protein GH733_001038 [Mirounga leonina]